jgi:tripartite-type tricarboxylate transporter receptor subunit TctC
MARMIAFAALLAAIAPATAQEWPTRPLTMVVPFAAAGGADVMGRIVAARLSELLGQQVIVENVGGAGGMIGGARSEGSTRRLCVPVRQLRHPCRKSDALQESAL